MQTGKFLFKIISYVTLLRTSKMNMYFVHESKWFLSDFCYSHFQKMKQCSWSKVQNRLLPSLFYFFFQFSRKVMYIYVFKKNEKLCLLSYLCLFPRYLVHLSSVRLVSWKWFFVSTLFCMSNTFWLDNVLEQSFISLLVKIGVFLSLSHCILDTGVYFIIQNNGILYDMM